MHISLRNCIFRCEYAQKRIDKNCKSGKKGQKAREPWCGIVSGPAGGLRDAYFFLTTAARSLWIGSTMKDPLSTQHWGVEGPFQDRQKGQVVAQSLSPLPAAAQTPHGGLPERRPKKMKTSSATAVSLQ